MSKKVTAIRYCQWCGDPFEVRSPNQKYCPKDEKDCSRESVKAGGKRPTSTETDIRMF